MNHQPVLLQESIEWLCLEPDGIYVDATAGRGGHSAAILERLSTNGRLILLDRDEAAIIHVTERFRGDQRVSIHRENFADLDKTVESLGMIGQINGVLMDLGVSSPQLDVAERGFSFLRDGPLDMRMDQRQNLTAAQWINSASETEIADAFFYYGDERFSRRISRAIVSARKNAPILTTLSLAECIAAAHPKWQRGKHPATQCFQAIRIVVNGELAALENALAASERVLKEKGRVVVITFHSAEDRTIKQFIRRYSEMHRTQIEQEPLKTLPAKKLRRIAKVMPQKAEVINNSRARSAKLLVMEKIV